MRGRTGQPGICQVGRLVHRRGGPGCAENDEHENEGPSKLQDMKMQDMKLQDMTTINSIFFQF